MALIDKCIAQWLLNNSPDDSIGVNHATAEGATYDASIKKNGSHSGFFDGLNDDFIADYAALDLKNDFTMEAWFRPSWLMNDNFGYGVLSWGPPATGQRRSIIVWNGLSGTGKVYFSGYGAAANLSSGQIISVDTWMHVVVSVSSAHLVKIYVNGVLKASSTVTLNSFTYDQTYIGRTSMPAGEYWNGHIDTIRIYNGVLTDGGISVGQTTTGEVAATHNLGVGVELSVGGAVIRRKLGGFSMVY